MPTFNCSNKPAVFISLVVLAGISFAFLGYNNAPPVSDARDYYLYAQNMVQGKGYSLDGQTFSTWREPVYPLFLVFFYKLFGPDASLPIKIGQVILVALAAFCVYLIFELSGSKRLGLFVAVTTALIPSYGYYTNLFQPEILMVFLLLSSFYLTIKILTRRTGWFSYIFLGVEFGLMGLMRSHLILFAIIIAFIFLLSRKPFKKIAAFIIPVFLIAGAWMTYVYLQTGKFQITSGRQELHLYTRAVRTNFSYREEAHYLKSWLERSISAGEKEDPVLNTYDALPLVRYYYTVLIKGGKSVAEIKKENIATIIHRPGHYLFGNAVEWVKLMFIEHFYPPVSPLLTRALRVSTYAIAYLLFVLGLLSMFISKNTKTRLLVYLGSIYVLYHWFVLSFFDTVPRFNTPYLVFYLIIGAAGIRTLFTDKESNNDGNGKPENDKLKIFGVLMAYNSASLIKKAYDSIPRHLFDDIICVDDGSTDNTVEVARNLGLKVFTHPHTGYGGNLFFGLRKSLEMGATHMIELHGDGQYDFSAVPLAIDKLRRGCDVLLGNRFHDMRQPLRDGMDISRYLGNILLSTIARVGLNINSRDLFPGFRAYSRKFLESVDTDRNSQSYFFSFEIIAQAKYAKLKICQIPVRCDYRSEHSSMKLTKGFPAIIHTIKIVLLYRLATLNIKRGIFAPSKK